MSFHNATVNAIEVDSQSYHLAKSGRGNPDCRMSPSALKAFSDCPARWIAGYESPPSESKAWGNLVDTLFLTPKNLDKRYAIKPETYPDSKTGDPKPFNANSTWCKKWLAEQAGKTVISKNDLFSAQLAVNALLADETIKEYRDSSDVQVQLVGEWKSKSGTLIPVECLIDMVPKCDSVFGKSLGDLKTTRNGSIRAFGRWCYQAGYHVQAAFDTDLYIAATGEDKTDWNLIIQENYAPYQVGRRLIGQSLIEIGRKTYQHALELYARCLNSGKWPAYDSEEEFSIIEAEPWMEFSALEDAMEDQQLQESEHDEIIP